MMMMMMMMMIIICSLNSQENGANGLSKMAETLVGKFRWVRADNTTRDILNGLSHVIEGSVTTSNQAKLEQGSSEIKDWVDDKNEARNKDQLAKVTAKVSFLYVIEFDQGITAVISDKRPSKTFFHFSKLNLGGSQSNI